jgi:F-type H+-transporting ATPase subunit epsilon
MDANLKLIILTPERKFFEGDVKELTTENDNGRLEILPKHIDLITSLVPTVTSFTTTEDKKIKIFTSAGVLRVEDNELNLLCETAEWPEEINLDRAVDARKKAENLLKAREKTDHTKAELKLKRALARIKVKS